MPPRRPSVQIPRPRGRHAVVDVFYRDDEAFAACLLVDELSAAEPTRAVTARAGDTARYEPGRFYRRELPPILRVLEKIPGQIDTVVVDGYVWLDRDGKPGLGAKLHEALQERVRVVGVAKSRYGSANHEEVVWRGSSSRPLYVTAAGLSAATAASWIRVMHGDHRIPTLLRLAHRLAKASANP